jgi:RND family efflux transporter MFP subunit
MKTSTKIIVTVAIAGIVAATVFKLLANKTEAEAKVYHLDVNTKAIVQADTVKGAAFNIATPFLGSFSPSREVTIASETSGKVIAVGISEGSTVLAGNLIAHLDDGVLRAQLNSAMASLANNQNTLKRYESAPTGVTQLQMDNARTQVITSQAQIQQLNTQINQYTIKAPFAGVITARDFDLGTIVSPGAPMATLIDISTLKLEVSVPEKYIPQFKNGVEIDVKTDVYPDAVFKGVVNYVSSDADASHNYTVKFLVVNKPQTPLRSGMYGSVILGTSPLQNAISIPRSALIGSSQNPQVYIVENGIARQRNIEVGASNDTRIQITKGLHTNDVVITGGLVNLSDGTKVEIK